MTQDIGIILPVMLAIFVAKLVADLLSKPLYKYLLDIKSLPYLDPDPVIVINNEEYVSFKNKFTLKASQSI